MFYFTSDLHFGHKNIIKYCNRPFETVEEMNETIIKNFNKTVKAGDTCYILGDIMMYDTEETQKCLNRLHGHIYLVRGNHDNMIKDNDLRFGWVKEYFTFRYNKEKFILCHYPFVTWNGSEHGSYDLHGHQHNNLVYNMQQRFTGLRRFDVGVDANNFTPVSVEEIIAFFQAEVKPRTNREALLAFNKRGVYLFPENGCKSLIDPLGKKTTFYTFFYHFDQFEKWLDEEIKDDDIILNALAKLEKDNVGN